MQPQPSEAWIELLSVIAHDLNTPIAAVKGFVELVQNAGPLNDKQQKYSDRALAGLQQMEQLVSRLLDLAWVDADKPLELNTCDVGALITDAVNLLENSAAQRDITLHVDIAPTLGSVTGDTQRLSQVIHNLIGNAIKYNRDGGSVWINAAGERDGIQVSVKDTGLGIPPEDQAKVFERFFRAKTNTDKKIKGTGLGLAIVKGVVEKHNGHIWLESVPGEGTTFTFTLPRRPAVSEGADDEPDEADSHLERHESVDYASRDISSEERDAVDDDTQESPQCEQDEDANAGEV
jgi:signal transduction histidine kinase